MTLISEACFCSSSCNISTKLLIMMTLITVVSNNDDNDNLKATK